MNIFEYTHADLAAELRCRYGKGRYHATAILRHLYGAMDTNFAGSEAMAAAPAFSARLAAAFSVDIGRVTSRDTQDGVVKFVTRLTDGLKVESVVLPMVHHKTVCVSSQAGCRMGCRFCETGKNGLIRNLRPAEIVGQVYTARKQFGPELRNVVFMGMGEPFDNYDNVVRAIDVICDQRGLDIARRRITISTAGLAGGLQKFCAAGPPLVKLAISLNAPNDRLRSELMPINRQLPLRRLKEMLLAFPLRKKYYFLFAYVLIPGVNDRPEHADQLARFLAELPSKVNLIAFNPGTGSPYRAPSENEITGFRDRLIARRVNIQQRSTRGRELMAACGQLGSATCPP